ncbi:MAG: hypothetical protein JSU75_06175 [Gammaproteobacteria bacterium]|nr:MAG: hypothetical protein JSU75_06175 [Gammaproteobacteria bacterium]
MTCLLSVLAACGGGEGQDPDPFVNDSGLAFVRRPVVLDDTGALVQPDIREALAFNEGADLFYRELASPSAPERNVTGVYTGGLGDVKDVEVSYDGARLLFAMRAPEIPGADPEDQPSWNIWEYDIAGNTLRRIISSDITAEAGEDVAPYYLPDGRIVFSSTRQRQSKAVLLDEDKPQFSALDEDRNEHSLVLHVMNSDGSDIHQVSFNQSHDLDPTVLSTGEVMFCRWDNMGSRNVISLYKMHPDGSELELLYGAHSHDTGTNGSVVQFIQTRERSDGRLQSIILPFSGSYRGGELVLIDSENYIDNTAPTAVNQGILTGPAQTPATINNVHTDNTISPGGLFSSAWPLHDGTDRMLVSWSQCRLVENNLIVPCTPDRLTNPDAVAADPLYGIFLYNRDDNTQLPVVVPEEGIMFTDVVAAEPRTLPTILFDKVAGGELDPQLMAEGTGVLNIRSVYDVDGVDTATPDIATLADPAATLADDRPARFLRIVKAVGIPDDTVLDLPGTAFGRSSAQLMREIIGYVPVQPDGSVRVKVPADVPLAISVVDRDGRRLGSRHQNWLQVRAGETLNCSGCHDHASNTPHGHPEGPVSVYAGAPVTGLPFPNTEPALFANFGETMAETLTRLDDTALSPAMDVFYDDVWTDPVVRAKDASFSYEYASLVTAAPASAPCQAGWNSTCRITIHYEQHIHPLWSVDRGVNTCTGCHTTDNGGGLMVPDAQLDLTDGASSDEPDHFMSYRELLFADNAQEVSGGILQDILVPGPIDPNTGLPTQVPVPVSPSMSTSGAIASTGFATVFAPGGTHDGRLDPAELRLIHEWLDIGAQYWNDPFAVPP